MKAKAPRSIWTNPIHFLAFGFGSGASPIMPGTCGTLVAIPLYWCLAQTNWWLYGAITAAAFVIGIWLCGVAAKDTGVHDHPGIVWDEFVGFWLTMFLVPLTWYWIVAGFVLFRLFDIVKPWPIKWLDAKVKGGFGIMIDDVLAAVYAWLILQALVYGKIVLMAHG
ncbi:MAG: phosphatidylglycerophosphatase A [Legionellales bacterium]|nr:phosphatidylglycerophosphatase A [Legionellales bacterium]|tara:strand:+ start:35788 stop:36285 length:498 start_codon:yes stop_codon:yes gene_type:complete